MSLDVLMSIHGVGGWIDLEDPVNGYEAHKDSLASRGITWRKHEIESDYVEGTFVNDAVRGNVVEAVVITVQGATAYELRTRMKVVTDALEQLSYQMKVTIGDAEETWDCFCADYTIESAQELQHALKIVVRASVPRLPATTLVQVI